MVTAIDYSKMASPGRRAEPGQARPAVAFRRCKVIIAAAPLTELASSAPPPSTSQPDGAGLIGAVLGLACWIKATIAMIVLGLLLGQINTTNGHAALQRRHPGATDVTASSPSRWASAAEIIANLARPAERRVRHLRLGDVKGLWPTVARTPSSGFPAVLAAPGARLVFAVLLRALLAFASYTLEKGEDPAAPARCCVRRGQLRRRRPRVGQRRRACGTSLHPDADGHPAQSGDG